MATGDVQTKLIQFEDRGINLRLDPKRIPEGGWQSMLNTCSELEGSITPRRGRRLLGSLPATATAPHSAGKLAVTVNEVAGSPSANPRYVGDKGDVWRSKTLATGEFTKVNPAAVCTTPSFSHISGYWSLSPYRAGSTGEAWAFLGGETAMYKDFGPYPMGGVNPLLPFVAGTSAAGVSPIIITTTIAHNFQEGDTVIISGVVGTGQVIGLGSNEYNAANGIFANIHVIDATHFSLPNTISNVDYDSGGSVIGGLQPWGIRPANGTARANVLSVLSVVTPGTPVVIRVNPASHGFQDHSPVTIHIAAGPADHKYFVKVVSAMDLELYTDEDLTAGSAGDGVAAGDYFVGNLDGGDDASPAASVLYKWVFTYRNPLTGNEGNPSQIMVDDSAAGFDRDDVDPVTGVPRVTGQPLPAHNRVAIVTGWGTDDPQIPVGAQNTVVFYRTGGLLADGAYRFVGFGVNPGLGAFCSILDNTSDPDLAFEDRIAEFDNDPPVPSTLKMPWLTTIINGPYAATKNDPLAGGFGPVVVREAPPAMVRVGSILHFRGLPGSNNQESAVIQAIGTTTISSVVYTTLMLYLQYKHLEGERIEVDTAMGQPCSLACSAFDSMFVAGDANNPHVLYKSKTGQPESFPISDAAGITHAINVGSPANPIKGICEFRGNILCLNATNLYEVSVFNGIMYGPNDTPAQRGLLTQKAWCVADNEVWYLSYDGIWSWSGGQSVKRSEAIDPIFHGVTSTFAGLSLPPMFMDQNLLQYARLEYARKQIHFFYPDVFGHMFYLVYDILFDRWLPGSKNGPGSPGTNQSISHLFLERDTGNLLYFRNDPAGGVICLDDAATYTGQASDEYLGNPLIQGTAIPWLAVTGWMDLGNAFVPKVFDEVLLETDAQGPYSVQVLYDYAQTAGDSFNVPAATVGRTWLALGLNLQTDASQAGALSGYGRQASVIAFAFSGNAQGYRPTIYGVKFRYRDVGEITAGPVYDWSDLGHKYDKRLYEFTVEFDTGNTNRKLILDTIGGVKGNVEADDVQSFAISNPTILGPGRAKQSFAIKDGVVCKLVRLRSVSTAPSSVTPAATYFRILSADFQKENYPADIVPFCEPQDDNYPYLKYLNQFNIDVDTGGVAIDVQLQADGTTVETVSIRTTAQDRDRTPTTNPNLVGRKWRWFVDTSQAAIATGGGKFQVFSHSFKFQPADKGEVVHTGDWDDLGHPFDKRLYTVTLEWDNTGGAPVTMVLDLLTGIGGGTVQSSVQTFALGTAGRSEKTFALIDGLVCKKIRLYPQTSPLPATFKHWRYSFQAERYPADTVLFTEWEDGGTPYLKYLNQLTLDVDTQDAPIQVKIQVDGGITVQEITVLTGQNTRDVTPTTKPNLIGRRWRLLIDPNQSYLTSGTGKFQLFGHSFKFQPADKGEVGHTFGWDDLDYPFDKRLSTVTIEWDNGEENDIVMQLDLRGGIGGGTLTSNVQQFTITGGRSKRTWGINDYNIAKLVRIYPLNTSVNFRQWKYSFNFEKLPADTIFFTPSTDCDYPYEKIAKVLDVHIDTGGTDCVVHLEGDGQKMDAWTINTSTDDRRRMLAVRKDQIAKLWRLTFDPHPAGKAQLWTWSLLHQKEPPYITTWRSYELTFGYAPWKFMKGMFIQYIAPQGLVVLIESDTGAYTKILPAHTRRDTERFLLPAVFGDGLNKSKRYIITFGSAASTPAGGPSMQFGLPDDFTVGTSTLNIQIRTPFQLTRVDWTLSLDVGELPVGSDAILDIQVSNNFGGSWYSIFPPGNANKIVVPAAGPNFGSVTFFSAPILNQGDWVKVVALAVGSTTAGKGLQALCYGNVITPSAGPLFKLFPDGSWAEFIPCGADRHTGYQRINMSDFMKFEV